MSRVTCWSFIFFLNFISINCKICNLCKCFFLDIRPGEIEIKENFEMVRFDFKPSEIEPFNGNASYADFVEKYFYVNCFDENKGNSFDSFQWPHIKVLGIIVNFKNNKWQKLQYLPDEIKNQVTVLSVSNNFIAEIEKSELDGFSNLKMLNLSKNKLEKIKKSTFTSTTTLEILDLSENKISELEDWSFYGTSLKFLNLSKNVINHLSADVFRGLNNLIYLDLSRNNLNKLPDNFGLYILSLKFLFLQNNELQQLPELPKNLKKLNVSNNNLSELRITHSSLEVLNLDKNYITSLADSSFANLKVLVISHNNLASLTHLGSSEIITLDVSYNRLTEIPEIISSDTLPFLQDLILNGNSISNISFPRQIRPFENLKKFSCSNCKFKKLFQNTFENVFSDKKYDCSGKSGLTLNFSHNMINYVEKEIFKNFQICSIDLSNNELSTFFESVLPWREMTYINLQNNPWQCDCNIQWMLKDFLVFMYNNQPQLLFDLKCRFPLRYKNKMFVMWYNKTEDVFCKSWSSKFYSDLLGEKSEKEIWTASNIACIVLGCFIFAISIAIIVLLRKKPNSKMKKGMPKKNVTGKLYYKPINDNKDNSEKLDDDVV